VAAALLLDATSYALKPADPVNGRPMGCYTILDTALGLGPSEGGFLTGTRLVETLLGLPLLLFSVAGFIRKLWRSILEVPLVALVATYGMWLSGDAFFWRFHDTNVYLTWRIIGSMSNDLAAEIVASAVVLVNVLAVVRLALKTSLKAASRRAAYTSLGAYIVAIVFKMLEFPGALILLVVALPLLLFPALSIARLAFRNPAA